MSNARDASDSTFDQSLESSDLPTLVDFWAPWCGPCRLLAPILDRVTEAYAGQVRVLRLNVDEYPKTSLRYDIRSIPTLILFKDGQPAFRIVGLVPFSDLRAFLDSELGHVGTPTLI